jgi:hypothetical protein
MDLWQEMHRRFEQEFQQDMRAGVVKDRDLGSMESIMALRSSDASSKDADKIRRENGK